MVPTKLNQRSASRGRSRGRVLKQQPQGMKRTRRAFVALLTAIVLAFGVGSAAYANPIDDVVGAVTSFFTGSSNDESSDAGVSTQAVEDYTVTGVSPRGTTINVFDYWITSQDDPDNVTQALVNDQGELNERYKQGINADHTLKFGAGMGTSTDNNEDLINRRDINYWTGDSAPRQGIVSDTLTDGYPTLSNAGGIGSESLAYLFDNSTQEGKAAYMDVDGLLQVDDQGYYYYNSQDNFAQFNADGSGSGNFTLYNRWGVEAAGSSPDGQFFPFNTGDEVFDEQNGQLVEQQVNTSQGRRDLISTDEVINHYFGLNMSTRFIQQNGGYTAPDGTQGRQQVTYNFSGDDDVWIYIDGVLVGDLGGIHDATSIEINFATGRVYIYDDGTFGDNDSRSNNNEYDQGETLYNGSNGQTIAEIMRAAGVTTGLTDTTFADDTYHTLDFFYLERGNTDSNMSLKYNLVNIPESGVVKVDQNGDTLEGVTYQLYPATVDGEGNYTTKGSAYYTGTTDANGELTFTTTDGSGDGSPIPVTLEQLEDESQYWILREAGVPDGYRDPGDIWLRFENGMLLSSNPWDTGTYAQAQVTVTAADTLYERNSDGSQGSEVQTNDQGFIFAVVMQKQDDGSWSSVYGNAYDGWTVNGDDSDGSAIAAARQDLYRFTVGSGGAFQVDIDNLPGDILTYEYVLSKNGGNAADAKYTIAYYYTSADDINSANDGNTTRLYVNRDANTGAGGYEGFDRVFSVTLNVSNIKNELTLHKTNADGSENLQGATYTLYNDENNNGVYDAGTDTEAQTGLTTDANGELQVYSDAENQILENGNYVLVETAAPEDYQLDATPIRIVVDDDGVHVNAGTADDNVTVETGLGTLAWSMKGFAAGDHVDATLHDVQAQPQTATSYSADGTSWSDATGEDATAIHLQYENDGDNTLDYALAQTEGNATDATYTADAGWSRLNATQCLNHDSSENALVKQDLGDQSLNALFTGDVTIHVTNDLIPTTGSLRVDKDVTGTGAPTGAEFTYTLNLTNGGQALTDSCTITKYNENDQQVGDAATIADGETFTLQDGQYVVISDIPQGTSYSVTEAAADNFTPSVEGGTSTENNVTANGTITATQSQVTYTNTYVPDSVELDVTEALQVVKNLTGKELSGNPDDSTNFDFTIEPVDTEGQGGATAEEAANKINQDLGNDGLVHFSNSSDQNGPENDTWTSVMIPLTGGIEFTVDDLGKTFTYQIREVLPSGVSESSPTLNGITYDTDVHTVAYTVSMDGSSLKVDITVDGTAVEGDVQPTVSFDNSYQPESVTTDVNAPLSGTKTVENEHGTFSGIQEGQFAFWFSPFRSPDGVASVYPSKGQSVDGHWTVTNDAQGNFDFGTLTFTEPGEYVFTIREADTNHVAGITNDSTVYTLSYTVEDNNGQLEIVSQSIKDESNNTYEATELDFTNIYNDGQTSYTIGGTKVFETNGSTGEQLDANEFSFALYEVGADGTETYLQTVTNGSVAGNTASFAFDEITYIEAGTHTYKVYELGTDGQPGTGGTDANNVTYSTEAYTVAVSVSESNDGRGLSVSADVQNADIVFTNTYAPTPVVVGPDGSAQIGGTKALSVAEGSDRSLQAGEFEFLLRQGDQEVACAANDANGNFVFDSITFDTAGTYYYTVSEVDGGLGGVSYDSTIYTVRVDVTENVDANALEAKVTYIDNADTATELDAMTFANTYQSASTAATLGVSKELQDGTLADGQFTFELTGSDGAPMPESTTVTNNAQGVVSFGSITFDAVGEYDYTVTEVNDGQDGITYDEDATRTIHVSVTDDGEGHLVAEVTYGSDGSHFVNVDTTGGNNDGGDDGDGGNGGDNGGTGDAGNGSGNGSSFAQTNDATPWPLAMALALVAAGAIIAAVFGLRRAQR